MTFIEQFEQEFARKLESPKVDSSEIIRFASEKVLESYRNGITTGQKGTTVKCQGQSRRRTQWSPELSAARGESVRRGIAYKREREADNSQ